MNDWIDVKDRLPETDQEVLIVCWWSLDESSILIGVYGKYGWHSIPDDEDRFPLESISHWMPLPALPPHP
jgi:hypothetical protein